MIELKLHNRGTISVSLSTGYPEHNIFYQAQGDGKEGTERERKKGLYFSYFSVYVL